jgi:peptidoglycan/LPS O-acetylase OafA/YrhL
MASTVVLQDDVRFRASGDEAGTPIGDRKFRPDVEGLRAIAVGLVVLYHAGVTAVSGGYIGVDVFFVISGFVITGLLLRERSATGSNRIAAFYGRRARRILPAATLVIGATVIASYHWLGFVSGARVASDARAAALFVANFHFAQLGTNYLSSNQPPSPLQNFWSLAVEEQFYVAYPALFILIAVSFSRRLNYQARLAIMLCMVIAGSYLWSIVQTNSNGTVAYFSPFTRGWELALGGLIAVAGPVWKRVPRTPAAIMSWVGVGAICYGAVEFNQTTPYPGSIVAIPVVGAALVIAGGTPVPRFGAEVLLRVLPFQWLGKLSYSLYLWHWPVLIIAAQQAGRTLPVGDNLAWVALAIGLSIVTYFTVENPVRHARVLVRHPLASIGIGSILVATSILVLTVELHIHP